MKDDKGNFLFQDKLLLKVGIQRVKRINRGQGGKLAHNIYYSEHHNAIVYDYWPGARFMMLIAPRHKMQKYLRIFMNSEPNRRDRLWLWLNKYELM